MTPGVVLATSMSLLQIQQYSVDVLIEADSSDFVLVVNGSRLELLSDSVDGWETRLR